MILKILKNLTKKQFNINQLMHYKKIKIKNKNHRKLLIMKIKILVNSKKKNNLKNFKLKINKLIYNKEH